LLLSWSRHGPAYRKRTRRSGSVTSSRR
jgi:hypothetical protein